MTDNSKKDQYEVTISGDGTLRRRPIATSKVIQERPRIQIQSPQLSDALQDWLSNKVRLTLEHDDSIELELMNDFSIPSLPSGYYFKGGVAREILRRNLFPESPPLPFRDYDIVRFAHTSDRHDHDLSLRFMQDDYEFGRGVEVVEDSSVYFKTRDLSVNEVLLSKCWVRCSYQSLQDHFDKMLRPAPYVRNAEGMVQSRILAKAIRIYAESLVRNVVYELTDIPEKAHIFPFDIALHLDRALTQSEIVATEYLEELWKRKLLPETRDTPPDLKEAVELLCPHLEFGVRFFRNLPLTVLHALS